MTTTATKAPRPRTEVIIIRETALQSVISDAVTFTTVAGLPLIGWSLDIAALEWIGGIMAMLTIISRTTRNGKSPRLTVEQARDRLDTIERDQMANR